MEDLVATIMTLHTLHQQYYEYRIIILTRMVLQMLVFTVITHRNANISKENLTFPDAYIGIDVNQDFFTYQFTNQFFVYCRCQGKEANFILVFFGENEVIALISFLSWYLCYLAIIKKKDNVV